MARVLAIALVCASGVVLAQPSANDLRAAAASFAQAQEAQAQENFARAAELFEAADRSAPSPEALRSAIRARRAAHQLARAATLALAAQARYPSDVATAQLAGSVIDEAGSQLGRLHVRCAPSCELLLAEEPIGSGERLELYVDPGELHLRARWPEQEPIDRALTLAAGQERELELEGPPAPPPRAPEPAASGVHPAFMIVGSALALLGAVVAIWSGIDTMAARDRYLAAPTSAGYADEMSRQWRTITLWIATGVATAATIALTLFTDWDQAGAGTPLLQISAQPGASAF